MKGIDVKTIGEWKQKFGEISVVEFSDGSKAYFKKPTRQVVSMAMVRAQNNPLGLAEVIAKNCLIGGDFDYEGLLQNVGYLVGLTAKVDELIGTVTGEVKKL